MGVTRPDDGSPYGKLRKNFEISRWFLRFREGRPILSAHSLPHASYDDVRSRSDEKARRRRCCGNGEQPQAAAGKCTSIPLVVHSFVHVGIEAAQLSEQAAAELLAEDRVRREVIFLGKRVRVD